MHQSLKQARHYYNVSEFLYAHAAFLNEHDYDAVSSTDDEYENLTYLSWYVSGIGVRFSVQGPEAKELMTTFRRYLGGQWKKEAYKDTFTIYTDTMQLRISIDASRKAVCTPKQVGEEVVTIPAVEAQPERTQVKPILEWDCGTLLSDSPQEAAQDA